jgi:hypothetical protein
MTRRRRLVIAAIAVVALLATAGCVPTASGVSADPYDAANVAYGRAPQPEPGVTLQPDVVIIGGGGASVRGVSADGFTWILDPEAPNTGALAVGSIMFVTERGVGRVIDLQTIDDNLVVTIGPVEITEVIRDGEFATETEVSLDRAIVQDPEGAFWADPDVLTEYGTGEPEFPYGDQVPEDVTGTVGTSSSRSQVPSVASAALVAPRRPAADIPGPPTLPRPPLKDAAVAASSAVTSGGFNISGSCCADGVGADFTYDKNGVRILGSLKLKMASPKVTFDMKISGGTLQSAEFLLSGGGSVHTQITASTSPGPAIHRASQPLGMNLDFSIPVATILGIPFSVTVSQLFSLDINLPGTAQLEGTGDFSLGGGLGFTYRDGALTSTTTGKFDAAASVTASNSIAVGISYAVIDYQVSFRLGIGMMGFTAGLDFGLAAHSTLTMGAPIGFNTSPDAEDPIMKCKTAQGELWLTYGVGYSIPAPIVKVVNFFLKYFNTTPIEAKGGSHNAVLVGNSFVAHPDSKLCH